MAWGDMSSAEKPQSKGLTESYVCGTGDIPLNYQTIGDCFDEIAGRYPDQLALVVCHQNIRWTYRELKAKVDTLAQAFIAMGLRPQDRLGIWSPNRVEWVLTQLAAAKVGLILVNINPAYRLHELEYVLNNVECKALVTATAFKSSNYIEMLQELLPELSVCPAGRLAASKVPTLEWVIQMGAEEVPGMIQFEALMALAQPQHHELLASVQKSLLPDEAMNIQFTSGTTGFPKGATLSHFNILNNGYFVASRMSFTHQDRLCIPVPLYHCMGMVMANLGCISHGAAMVFPSEGFDPKAVLEAVEKEGCTGLFGVPTMFIAELEHADFAGYNLSTLRTGVMAGAPCPIELMRQVVEKMHLKEMTICYGMTETSPVSFQTTKEDSMERQVTTVGRIHPHVEAKIIDNEGRVVPVDTPGELLVRGYSVMQGYWGNPERTQECIDEAGWMHSGDLATLDGEGYCNIVGRVKDMIIRGGENIYPREVEEFLHQHPKIQDVQCFGVPDPKYGEALCAWIQVKPGQNLQPEEITGFCKGQIAHYKIPAHIRFVEEYPMTVTGKIQKFRMRELMTQELGTQTIATA